MNIKFTTAILVVILAANVVPSEAAFNMLRKTLFGTTADDTVAHTESNTDSHQSAFIEEVTDENEPEATPSHSDSLALVPAQKKRQPKGKKARSSDDHQEKGLIQQMTDKALESQGIVGGQETLQALHALHKGEVPDDKVIENLAKMAQNKGVALTDDHINLAKEVGEAMRSKKGVKERAAIAGKVATMVADLGAAKGYISAEHQAAATQSIEAIKNGDIKSLASAVTKVLVHKDVFDGAKDMGSHYQNGNYSGMASAGLKMLSGAAQSRGLPPMFRGTAGAGVALMKSAHTVYTTGSAKEGFNVLQENAADLGSSFLPVPAGALNTFRKAATQVMNGKKIQDVVVEMGQDEVMRHISGIPGLGTVVGSVMKKSPTGDDSTQLKQLTAGAVVFPETFELSPTDERVLREMIGKYEINNDITDPEKTGQQKAVEVKQRVARPARQPQKSRKEQAEEKEEQSRRKSMKPRHQPDPVDEQEVTQKFTETTAPVQKKRRGNQQPLAETATEIAQENAAAPKLTKAERRRQRKAAATAASTTDTVVASDTATEIAHENAAAPKLTKAERRRQRKAAATAASTTDTVAASDTATEISEETVVAPKITKAENHHQKKAAPATDTVVEDDVLADAA